MEINIVQVSASGNYAVASANGPGGATIPSGNCAGTPLGLSNNGLKLRILGTADANGRASHSPSIPADACQSSVVVVDLVACEVSNVAAFVTPLLPECGYLGHTALDQPWRNVDFNDGNGNVEECDIGAAGGNGWYRFTGTGGKVMPETPQVAYDCGTDAPGWINGRHPNDVGNSASLQVCYHWSGNDCNWSNNINVTNCGPFFVYELVDPPAGCLAYCSE